VLAAGGGQQVLRWSRPGWTPLPSLSTWCSSDGLKACVVRAVSFSPDGRTLLARGIGPLRRWDAATGEEQGGRRTPAMVLANRGDDWYEDLLDLTAESQPRTVWGGMWTITSVAFQPGERIVALGRKDMTVTLLDGTGQKELRVLHGHTAEVTSLAWTRDGRVLISGGEDGEIRFWSSEGQPLAVLRAVEDTSSSYVFTEGAEVRIEVFGAEAERFPVCRAGRETLPFPACAERFGVKGLLAAALAGEARHLEP
jgi:WD40 repeat protein